MTDETQITAPETEKHDTPQDQPHEHGEERPNRLEQFVEVRDVGPCKKHLKVTVARAMIDSRLKEKFRELGKDTVVPGFRPGKAPMRVLQKRYKAEVNDQVKTEVLLASLEQLADEQNIAPLAAPNINPNQLVIPDTGDFIYEFEVEVRPEFDLPPYKGLKLRRPVRVIDDNDVEQEVRRLLQSYGQVVPKPEGNAQLGDVIVADVVFRDGDTEISSSKELQIRVDKQIVFKDATAPRFAEQVVGVNIGESRTADLVLSTQSANPALSGKTVQMTLEVRDIKAIRLPELTHEFLHNFGVHSEEQFRELAKAILEQRIRYQQRQSAREQVMQHIAASASWELPRDLLMRQARKALARRVMEMRSEGIPEEEIAGRERVLRQDILQSTEASLKEHFVLQKIAELEKIEVNDQDLEEEMDRMSERSGESPRRIRARLEKDDLLDALAAEMIERKALDLILNSAEYEDIALSESPTSEVGTMEEQAVPGEMRELEAETPPSPEEEQAPSA